MARNKCILERLGLTNPYPALVCWKDAKDEFGAFLYAHPHLLGESGKPVQRALVRHKQDADGASAGGPCEGTNWIPIVSSGERSDVSWISVETPDRQKEVVIAKGMNDSQFAVNPLVTLEHNYQLPPVVCAVHRIDYSLSWNYAHLVNPVAQLQLESVCKKHALRAPLLVSPESIPKRSLGQTVRRRNS
jgi:hypothetical protein